eukprot:CAMPEP_0178436542 /NCGR_PEP_ID=MMETSP0689_2-20121128/34493_1 /TAXON_ID=160604 /ORGANISM="Amphidinium massartii, Strain CS-259" /LENGTH=286 /DNA_ID=CAMNT_0020058641 /DNA_START=26 /DNA_END=883 /DNA_ORIENTATION=-
MAETGFVWSQQTVWATAVHRMPFHGSRMHRVYAAPATTAASAPHAQSRSFDAATSALGGLVIGLSGALRVSRRSISRSSTTRRAEGGRPRLYGNQGSRSPLVNWYLFEIGQEFDFVDASMERGPHPFGQIPSLVDGDVEVFESGAILMYLADKYGGLNTPELRAEAGKWVVWANATLDPICFKEIDGRVVGTGLADDPRQIARFNEILEGRKFILGDEFSVADVAIGSYLLYVLLFFPNTDVTKWPNVRLYMKSLCERDAYAKAFGPKTAQMLSEALSKESPPGLL